MIQLSVTVALYFVRYYELNRYELNLFFVVFITIKNIINSARRTETRFAQGRKERKRSLYLEVGDNEVI